MSGKFNSYSKTKPTRMFQAKIVVRVFFDNMKTAKRECPMKAIQSSLILADAIIKFITSKRDKKVNITKTYYSVVCQRRD